MKLTAIIMPKRPASSISCGCRPPPPYAASAVHRQAFAVWTIWALSKDLARLRRGTPAERAPVGLRRDHPQSELEPGRLISENAPMTGIHAG
ncbi:hypothetical protein Misp02_55290 [Microtetraspora sp. NBRC 16547]|nr:hypothetical protein Misp02_55290 [Microtetraspora sp. NBRC 16547]